MTSRPAPSRLLSVWALLLVPVLAATLFASESIPSGPLPSAAPLPGATVEGIVRDASTGAALAGANVSLVGTALGAATDASGRFTISGTDAGTADVRVTRVGYEAHVERGVVLRDGETAQIDVRLVAADIEVVVAGTGERLRRAGGVEFGGTAAAPPPSASPGVLSARSAGAPSGGMRAPSRGAARPESREATADDAASRGDNGERSAPRDRTRRPVQQPRAGLLTAGDIDDGLNWDAFLGYSSRAVQQGSVLTDLRLDDRLTLRILDRDGRPVAGARVRIDATGGRQRSNGLTTEAGTDGRLALFPRYDFGSGVDQLAIFVTPPGGGTAATETLDLTRLRGDSQRTIRLRVSAQRPQALDLAIVLDVTGSMGDEHRYITDEFENIVAQARRRYPDADLRFGLVAYRDHGDQFVVRRWDFTRSEREMRERLAQLDANGGGDMPEAMDEALDAMLELDWRTGTAARIAFLVADAPPHANRLNETLAAVREARARGLRLYPLGASGVDASAEHVMRTAAVLTQGRYLWLTDDSGVGIAHAEPTVPCYQVSRVDRLIARVIESELAGRRIETDRQDVIRSVGNPVGGVCGSQAVSQQSTPRRNSDRADGLGYD